MKSRESRENPENCDKNDEKCWKRVENCDKKWRKMLEKGRKKSQSRKKSICLFFHISTLFELPPPLSIMLRRPTIKGPVAVIFLCPFQGWDPEDISQPWAVVLDSVEASTAADCCWTQKTFPTLQYAAVYRARHYSTPIVKLQPCKTTYT